MRFALPIAWVVGFVTLQAASMLVEPMPANGGLEYAIREIEYDGAPLSSRLAIGAVFVVFAAIYAFFEKGMGVKYRTSLGVLHFVLMLVGAATIFVPQGFLRLVGASPGSLDYPDAFRLWNTVSTVGYVVMALSIVAFVLVVVDAGARQRKLATASSGEGRPDQG